MLTLNVEAPEFALEGVQDGSVRTWKLPDFRGSWLVLFFYPADFTFVCPTEIRGFEKHIAEFRQRRCAIAGISVDDLASHAAWVQELGGLSFPLLSDPEGRVARDYGVLNPEDGRAFRATFLVTPDGRLAWTVVSPMNVGRSVSETLRVLDALQTGRLCPADWRPGEETFDPALKY